MATPGSFIQKYMRPYLNDILSIIKIINTEYQIPNTKYQIPNTKYQISTMSREQQDIEQVQQVYSKYGDLTLAMRTAVLNDPTVKNASPRLLDIWHYTNRFIGATGFVYHAAQVARMCGLSDDMRNFKRRYLEEYGERGVDWEYVKKSEVFTELSGENSNCVNSDTIQNCIVLPVPGSTTGETVSITPGGNAAKFPMLTEKFARRLILRCGQKGLDKDYAEFLLAMNDIVVRVATGQGVHREAEDEQQSRGTKRPATWQEELEYEERSQVLAKKRREEAEHMFAFLAKYANDGSERDQIHQFDFQRNVAYSMANSFFGGGSKGNNGAVLAIRNGEDEHREITISEVACNVLGRQPTSSELKKFGNKVSQLYFRKYETRPPKRNQYVDGAPRQVNSYTTKDLDLIEEGIKSCK